MTNNNNVLQSEDGQIRRRIKRLPKYSKILIDSFVVFLVLLGVIFVYTNLPDNKHLRLYVVMSGSMEPTIQTGSLIITQEASDYKINDVITFANPKGNNIRDNITHRINNIVEVDGQTKIYTKGDANNAPDVQLITKDKIIGKNLFSIPKLGFLISFLKTLPGLIFIIVIPCTIIVYEELKKIKHETKQIIHRRKSKKLEANHE